jgi:hypothetical protein
MAKVQTFLTDARIMLPLEEVETQQISPITIDIWLFTDPLAKVIYTQRGELRSLEQDIRNFAMFQGVWGQDELQFKREIDDLCDAKIIAPEHAFGNVSPHPTIYKAFRPGKIEIGEEKYHFHIGDEIIFASWIERLSHPGINEPLRIGRFDTSAPIYLCSQAYPQLSSLSHEELEGLHKIACYPNHRSG